MTFQAGVLIIGSLLWDGHKGRSQWRTQRLNEQGVKHVDVPIRYGRFSEQRNAYTMVFSRLCYRHSQLGRGVIVPFAGPIESFDDLRREAECLADAEGLDDRWNWGAVGLLKRPSSKVPVNILEQWTGYFKERSSRYQAFAGHTSSEPPTISKEGFLNLRWPLSAEDAVQYDFLLATPTKARVYEQPNLKRYPHAREIATLLPTDRTKYFINNVLHDIRTSQDSSIWKAMTMLHPKFAAGLPQIARSFDEDVR